MRRLKPGLNVPRGGSFRLNLPDRGFVGEGYTFDVLVGKIKDYRTRNGLDNPPTLRDELEAIVCDHYPDECDDNLVPIHLVNGEAPQPVALPPRPRAIPVNGIDVRGIEADSDVAMPVCALDHATLFMSLTAIRTLRQSTTARVTILGNNTPDAKFRSVLERNCELLQCKWVYDTAPFFIARTLNAGFDLATGKYMATMGADTIFFDGWYANLIALFEANQDFFTLSPISFHHDLPDFHRFINRPEPLIWERHICCSAGQVFKREDGWRWDEKTNWSSDSDLHHFLLKNNFREGYCLNSRVDHLITGFRSTMPRWEDHMGGPKMGESDVYFRAKWKL